MARNSQSEAPSKNGIHPCAAVLGDPSHPALFLGQVQVSVLSSEVSWHFSALSFLSQFSLLLAKLASSKHGGP